MLVYLIRHASTMLGERGCHLLPDTPISETGKQQAKQAAKRLAGFEINCIVSSTFERAKETAELINQVCTKPLHLSKLFIETKRPSEIEGKQINDPAVVAIESELNSHMNDLNWQYSDEETIFMLRLRAIEALNYIVSGLGERVLVVLHGDILRMLLTVMQHGSEAHPELFFRFRRFAKIHHTGITTCHFDQTSGWRLWSWNDHSHLG